MAKGMSQKLARFQAKLTQEVGIVLTGIDIAKDLAGSRVMPTEQQVAKAGGRTFRLR